MRIPKYSESATEFEIPVKETNRYTKESPGIRYMVTFPKVLVNKAEKNSNKLKFSGKLTKKDNKWILGVSIKDSNKLGLTIRFSV